MNDININDISMYGEHGIEMIDDNIISRHTTFSSEKIIKSHAGATNPNILHNWDFRNPVNQKRQLVYTEPGYTIDRWVANHSRIELLPTGIQIQNTLGSATVDQIIEFPQLYHGKTLTASMEIDGIVYSLTIENIDIYDNTSHTFYLPNGLEFALRTGRPHRLLEFRLVRGTVSTLGQSFIVSRAKLELGTVSTLANDPPMDYGRELAICRRYQIMISDATTRIISMNSSILWFAVSLPTSLRINPVISARNFLIAQLSNANEIQGFVFTNHLVENGVLISASKVNHGLSDARLIMHNAFFDANL